MQGLYQIVDFRTDSVNKITIRISLDPDHPMFKGHFPGNPILPGVATLQILKELVSKHAGKDANLARAHVIKYLNFINPLKNSLIDFDIEFRESEAGNTECSATVYYEETVFCTFRGKFRY
jgi:3-hydroxyacyl-[acyl-carrier-protein] dehydratase